MKKNVILEYLLSFLTIISLLYALQSMSVEKYVIEDITCSLCDKADLELGTITILLSYSPHNFFRMPPVQENIEKQPHSTYVKRTFFFPQAELKNKRTIKEIRDVKRDHYVVHLDQNGKEGLNKGVTFLSNMTHVMLKYRMK